MKHYFVERRCWEIKLFQQDLDWVIGRPPGHTNDRGTGRIGLGIVKNHAEIARGDPASAIVTLIVKPGVCRIILEVTAGCTPIRIAVRDLATR